MGNKTPNVGKCVVMHGKTTNFPPWIKYYQTPLNAFHWNSTFSHVYGAFGLFTCKRIEFLGIVWLGKQKLME